MTENEKDALNDVSASHEVETSALNTAVSLLTATIEKLKRAWSKESHELEQILGKALGYPIYPEGGPGPVGDVCVGDNVPASLAMEAAQKMALLQAEVTDLHRHADELGRGKNEALAECDQQCRKVKGLESRMTEAAELLATVQESRLQRHLLGLYWHEEANSWLKTYDERLPSLEEVQGILKPETHERSSEMLEE